MTTIEEVKPRIGLVVDSDLNCYQLRRVLLEWSIEPSVVLNSEKVLSVVGRGEFSALDESVDMWLIDVSSDSFGMSDMVIEHTAQPFLVNDNIPQAQDEHAYRLWQRRLMDKIDVIVSSTSHCSELGSPVSIGPNRPIEQVWVLVASLGGPEAVKLFLNALPPLPLALVYGQHIETNFEGVLAEALGSGHNYALKIPRHEQKLALGEIVVVPVDNQLRFLANGSVIATGDQWEGDYQPALDQIIVDLARIYRERLGVIVFSGMCNDSEIGCRVAKASGATIWAQSPESCICPNMPAAAISSGCVSYQGSPGELAAALAKKLTVDDAVIVSATG
ncbi:MAG: chemotaxis protein CheB [Oceanicoccus sp.]